MYCAQCGTHIPVESKFCVKCGNPSGEQTISQPARRKLRPSFWLLTFMFVALAINAAFLLSSRFASDAAVKQPVKIPVIQTVSRAVVDGSFVVEPNRYAYYKFSIPENATHLRLNGHFEATGGSGNDIEAFLIDEDAFHNWKNGHPPTTFYSSGRITADTLNVELPFNSRDYYLVFDNRFSAMSNKAVNANIKVSYERSL